ncbi:MAG: hypothetical protein VX447_13020 [Pseudomonadota bacterium]|uniref:hypothetical protein n=1 Tax=Gallaecimonas pentaromativorans TaxID=584787 RepID=UPI00067E8F9C|nr:hypothetical protein [Gallaecimonas pentaromativorans]MED5525658.1 hypothetical protein [Pseudomonadota bacterium]
MIQDYRIHINYTFQAVTLYCEYKSALGQKIKHQITVSEVMFNKGFSLIGDMLDKHTGAFDFIEDGVEFLVDYGGPDYQPVVNILVVKGEEVASLAIPEDECRAFLATLNL